MATTDKHRKVYDDNIQSVLFVRSRRSFLFFLPTQHTAYVVQWTYGIHIMFSAPEEMPWHIILYCDFDIFFFFELSFSLSVSVAAAATIFVRWWKNYGFRKICVWLRNIVHASSGNSSSSSRRMKECIRARHNRSLMLLKITCIINEFVHFPMWCNVFMYFNFSFFFFFNVI